MAASIFTPRASRSVARRQQPGVVPLDTLESVQRQWTTFGELAPTTVRQSYLQDIKDRAREEFGPASLQPPKLRTRALFEPGPRSAREQQMLESGQFELDPKEPGDEPGLLALAQRLNEQGSGRKLPATKEELDAAAAQDIEEAERERERAQARSFGATAAAGVATQMVSEMTNPIVLGSMAFGAGVVTTAGRIMPQLARIARIEAMLGSGSELAVQAIRQAELERLGIEETTGEVASKIALAGLGGAVFGPMLGAAGVGLRRLAGREDAVARAIRQRNELEQRHGKDRHPYALKTQRTKQEFLERDRIVNEALNTGNIRKAQVPKFSMSLGRADVDVPELTPEARAALRRVGDTEDSRPPEADAAAWQLEEVADRVRAIRGEINKGDNRIARVNDELAVEIGGTPDIQRALDTAEELVQRTPREVARVMRAEARANELRLELEDALRKKERGETPDRPESEIREELSSELEPISGVRPDIESQRGALSIMQYRRGRNPYETLGAVMRIQRMNPAEMSPEEIKRFIEQFEGRGLSRVREAAPTARQATGVQETGAALGRAQEARNTAPEGTDPDDPDILARSQATNEALADKQDVSFRFEDEDGNVETMTVRQAEQRTQKEQKGVLELRRCAGLEAEVEDGSE